MTSTRTRTRIVIDTDPGVDDALAILMATSRPDVRVEAITTVAGNVGIERTTTNAGAILDVAGVDAPIHRGASGPLIGRAIVAESVHGTDGLGDAGRSTTTRRPSEQLAAVALVEMARRDPGQLTLVALGPLTNLALATRLDPTVTEHFAELIVMGGAVRATGNSSAVAEFNIHADPEAATIVLQEWPRVTLVTWEATLASALPGDLIAGSPANGPRADFYRAVSEHADRYLRDVLGTSDLLVPDPLAMAVALDRSIVTRATDRHVHVELQGALTRGQTVVDWNVTPGPGETSVRIVEEVDVDRLAAMVLEAIA